MSVICDIIIPTCNLSEKTIVCFERILRYTKNYRIIWIDNGSNDDNLIGIVDSIARNKINCKNFMLDANLGFVKATNIGLAYSTAPWKVLMNNDVYVTEGWLDHMIKCAEENKYDIIGPLTSPNAVSYQGVTNMKKNIRDTIPAWSDYDIDIYANKVRQTMCKDHVHVRNGMVAFFCTLIHERVVKRIGYLSEEFGIGFGDDDDYSWRARNNGFRIGIDLGSFVHHEHRSTFKSNYSLKDIANMQRIALEKHKERKINLK